MFMNQFFIISHGKWNNCRMSLSPIVRNILVSPDYIIPASSSNNTKKYIPISVQYNAKCNPWSAVRNNGSNPQTSLQQQHYEQSTPLIQRHITTHPVLNAVAYVLEATFTNNDASVSGSDQNGNSSGNAATSSSSSATTTTAMNHSSTSNLNFNTNNNSHNANNSSSLTANASNAAAAAVVQQTNRIIVVQDSQSCEVLYSLHWQDLGRLVYNETDPRRYIAATKRLGSTVLSLQFLDSNTLLWSQQQEQQEHSQQVDYMLMIQTEKRILVVNLQYNTVRMVSDTSSIEMPTSSRLLVAHVCEKTIAGSNKDASGGIPSSNALSLSNSWILVGCIDGSMKCYDIHTNSVVKKIKGLGKGDYVVRLLAANPFCVAATDATTATKTTTTKRILTVTKRGTVYLIELVFSTNTSDNNNNNNNTPKTSIDIQPPLARFQIPPSAIADSNTNSIDGITIVDGEPTANTKNNTGMEHRHIVYDGHTDRLLWGISSTQNAKLSPILFIWNFTVLENEFRTRMKSKSLYKPDPTLIIQFPVTSLTNTTSSLNATMQEEDITTSTTNHDHQLVIPATSCTVVAGFVHPAFDEDTVSCITATDSGDICIHGAIALRANTTSTVDATPVVGVQLRSLLAEAIDDLDDDDPVLATLRIHSVTIHPFSNIVTVGTNWGAVILELSMGPSHVTDSVTRGCDKASCGMDNANRYIHFGAGLGSLGKSTITVQNSKLVYGSLDVLTPNPYGTLIPKNPVVVYESPPGRHMPTEYSQRPFRLAPVLLQSPTGVYVCLFWSCEYRYEILHTATLLQQVGQLRAGGGAKKNSTGASSSISNTQPVVATGTGVADFCWVSDSDTFAVLHAPDLQEQAFLQVPKESDDSGSYNILNPKDNLKLIGAGALGVASLATNATLLATSAAVSTTSATVGATTKVIKSGAKGVKKSFSIFGSKKKKGKDESSSIMTAAEEEEETESTMSASVAASIALQQQSAGLEPSNRNSKNSDVSKGSNGGRRVEFSNLVLLDNQSSELATGIPPATCQKLGELQLRGGNRHPPCAIFGGPVICVASRSAGDKEGHAYFYARKDADDDSDLPSMYTSTGPTLPYPDLMAWDDDGVLCAIVTENRIAVYISEAPKFVFLGTVRIASPTSQNAAICNVRFVHGTLFCCTWNSVHCIMLGDLKGGICRLDSYLLASTQIYPNSSEEVPFEPIPVSLPLIRPSVLGLQSGSLIVSTLRGVQAIPLKSAMVRIGLLLASGQVDRAAKWFDAVDTSNHERLAIFLERRGQPRMALQLPGLSLETIVDICMRHGYIDRLEATVDAFGAHGLHTVDLGRGVTPSMFGPENDVHSVMVCVGAYLLAHGLVEQTRRLASECLHLGDAGRKDAFMLGTLLLQVDRADALRLLQRSVAGEIDDDWVIGQYVRDNVLAD